MNSESFYSRRMESGMMSAAGTSKRKVGFGGGGGGRRGLQVDSQTVMDI